MLKSILKIGLFLFLTNFLFGQKNSFTTGKFTPKSFYAEIPYENINGKIIIPVIINNEEYRFIFDTGAPNIISKEIHKKINSGISQSISITDANQKRESTEITEIPNLEIGNLRIAGTGALVFEKKDNLVFECFEVDGIIGTNLVRDAIVAIRPKEQLIIITNQRKSIELDKDKALELILKGQQNSPNIKIGLVGNNKATETVLIDTGASGFYDLCKANYEQLKSLDILRNVETGIGSSTIGMFGQADDNEQYRLDVPEIRIGHAIFKNVSTITGDDDNSRIGSDILKYGNMIIDFKKEKFYFEPFENVLNLDQKLLGITPNVIDRKLVVGIVWDEELKDLIKSGDIITDLNGQRIDDLNLCDLMTQESVFKSKKELSISIKNNDTIKSFNLIRK